MKLPGFFQVMFIGVIQLLVWLHPHHAEIRRRWIFFAHVFFITLHFTVFSFLSILSSLEEKQETLAFIRQSFPHHLVILSYLDLHMHIYMIGSFIRQQYFVNKNREVHKSENSSVVWEIYLLINRIILMTFITKIIKSNDFL